LKNNNNNFQLDVKEIPKSSSTSAINSSSSRINIDSSIRKAQNRLQKISSAISEIKSRFQTYSFTPWGQDQTRVETVQDFFYYSDRKTSSRDVTNRSSVPANNDQTPNKQSRPNSSTGSNFKSRLQMLSFIPFGPRDQTSVKTGTTASAVSEQNLPSRINRSSALANSDQAPKHNKPLSSTVSNLKSRLNITNRPFLTSSDQTHVKTKKPHSFTIRKYSPFRQSNRTSNLSIDQTPLRQSKPHSSATSGKKMPFGNITNRPSTWVTNDQAHVKANKLQSLAIGDKNHRSKENTAALRN